MSAQRTIQVVLGLEQHLVGELIFEGSSLHRQHSAFRYHEEWLANPIGFAITPSMHLQRGWTHYTGIAEHSLPNPIRDTAPDSWGRNIIRADIGRDASELDITLAACDETRMGALRYIDEQGNLKSITSTPVPSVQTLNSLRQMNDQFNLGEGDLTQIAKVLRGSGDSLGGARPKSAIYDGYSLAIAKYTSSRDTMPVERMEVATLNLARQVGIRSSLARLELADTSYPVAVVQRFDREGSKRIHYISGHSFLNLQNSDDPVYYTDLVEVMNGNCGDGRQSITEIHELYKRVMFMILVSNTDDHMRNHGFLYVGSDRWILSPAFDINPQPDRHKQLKTGISELSGFEASIEALVEAAPLFELSEVDAASMAFEMASAIQRRWKKHCEDVGMSRQEINLYKPAFEHKEAENALAMDG